MTIHINSGLLSSPPLGLHTGNIRNGAKNKPGTTDKTSCYSPNSIRVIFILSIITHSLIHLNPEVLTIENASSMLKNNNKMSVFLLFYFGWYFNK